MRLNEISDEEPIYSSSLDLYDENNFESADLSQMYDGDNEALKKKLTKKKLSYNENVDKAVRKIEKKFKVTGEVRSYTGPGGGWPGRPVASGTAP